MTAPRQDLMIYPKMVDLAACLCRQIEDSGLPPTCLCGLLPGDNVAWDSGECDDSDGMAWVRLIGAGPYPGPAPTRAKCTTQLAFVVELGILRSFEYPEDGDPPTAAEYMAATALQMADMAAMRRAICCFADLPADPDYVMGSYTPLGPLGGIIGGTWQIQVLGD